MNTSIDHPRVSICCEPGFYLDDSSCYADDSIPAAKIVIPEIYHSNLTISSMNPEEFLPRYGRTDCSFNAVYELTENVLIYLLENGTIYVNHSINGVDSFGTDNYCLASQTTENGTRSVVSVCVEPHRPWGVKKSRDLRIASILAAISIPFLVVIFMIYTILPELRNIHGHVFRCYITALIFSYGMYIGRCMEPVCIYLIVLILQFSTLATFCWMNVMSFDIWWTFGGFGSLQRSTSKCERKTFIVYNCYAWGCSALITGFGMIMDILPIEWTGSLRPGLRDTCSFSSVTTAYIYLIGPLGVTLISNVYFFTSTVIKIIRQKRATAKDLEGTDSRRHDNKARERFNLYLKLFIVVGLSRMAIIIAWAYKDLPDYVWYVLVAERNLQGPIIFVIYVWNENTKEMLLNRLRSMCTIFRRLHSNNSNQSLPVTRGNTLTMTSPE